MLAALALAACSATAGAPATSTTSPLAAAHSLTAPACVLVQQADAADLFGHAATRVAVENKAHASSVCGYSADSSPDATAIDNVAHTLTVYVYDGTARFAQAKASDARPVGDLGDGAFQVTRGDMFTVVFTAHGQTVEIDFSITGLADHASPSADAVRVVDLARQALARM